MQFSKFSTILLISLGLANVSFAATNVNNADDDIKITKPSELNPQQSKLPDTLDIKDIKNAQNGNPPIKEVVKGNVNTHNQQSVNNVRITPNEQSPFYKRMEEINNIKTGKHVEEKKPLTPEEIAEEAFNKKMKKQEQEFKYQEKEFELEQKKINLEQRRLESKNKLDEAKNKKPIVTDTKPQAKETLSYYKDKFTLLETVLNTNLKQINKNIIITNLDNFLLYKNEKIAYIDKSLLNTKVLELIKSKNEIDDIKLKLQLLSVGKKTNNLEIAKEIDMKLSSEIGKQLQAKQVQNLNTNSTSSDRTKVKEGDIFESVVIVEKVEKDYVVLRVN